MDKNHTKLKHHFDEEDILASEEKFLKIYSDPNKSSIKTLIKLYNGHYIGLLVSGFFFFIKSCPIWILPIITSNIINIASHQNNPDGLLEMLNLFLLLVACVSINLPSHILHIHLFSKARRSVEAGLRGAMVRKLQALSITYYKALQSGRIQSKIMRDVEAIEGLSYQLFETVLGIILNVSISLVVVLLTNILVFFFFLLTVPAAALLTVTFRSKMRETNREFRKEVEQTSSDVMDMVELVPVTRAHAVEQMEIRKLTDQLTMVAENGYRLDIIQNIFGASSWVVFQIFQGLCLITTGYLAYIGKISVGEIALYQTYFSQIVNAVASLIGLLPTISKGTESIFSISEILSSKDIENNAGKEKLKSLNGDYNFTNVCFSYDDEHKILNNLNLTVHSGETIALVGESGAGKSTVLNMVIGFIIPTSGKLTVDGHDINSLDLRYYRDKIAVVPQTSIIFTGTIKDNITYGKDNVSDEKLNAAIKAANLKDFIDSLPDGLNTKLQEHGNNLSGGQKQRISIARAIIRDPKVIIFDEATSALDSISEKEIQHAINNLTKNRTTFIVAHRLSTIQDADKIAVIKAGRCIEYGTFDELMAKRGEFYKMKKIQS